MPDDGDRPALNVVLDRAPATEGPDLRHAERIEDVLAAATQPCLALRLASRLKENVIMGRLIPAGTGLPAYKRMTLNVEAPAEEDIPIPPPVAAAAEALAFGDE